MEPHSFEALWTKDEHDLEKNFQALAYSITNNLRGSRPDIRRSQNVSMSIGRSTVVYEMQWMWMALHCTALLLDVVFLSLTILRTAKTATPVYKSHCLGILVEGFHNSEWVMGGERGKEIDKWARENKFKLAKNDKDDGVMRSSPRNTIGSLAEL